MKRKIFFKDELLKWQKFYLAHFGIEKDFSKIPFLDDDCDISDFFLIVVAQGLTMNKVLQVTKKAFRVASVNVPKNNLDKFFSSNDRSAGYDYMMLAKRQAEADTELKNYSADDLDTVADFRGITLLERILLGLKYFSETGRHLDNKYWTLCSGTRNFNRAVPGIHFAADLDCEVIDFFCSHFAHSWLRAREVILPG